MFREKLCTPPPPLARSHFSTKGPHSRSSICPPFFIRHPRIGILAACYRIEEAQIPKSAEESAGKRAGKKGTAGSSAVCCFSKEDGLPALLPAVPPAVPFFLALPSTFPDTFGDLGFLSPVAGGQDSNPRRAFSGVGGWGVHACTNLARGGPQKKKNAWRGKWESFMWVNINLGVAPRIVGFALIKSWEAIPRMEFRIPRMEFPIPRAALRILGMTEKGGWV